MDVLLGGNGHQLNTCECIERPTSGRFAMVPGILVYVQALNIEFLVFIEIETEAFMSIACFLP
jgi:hypothetical protein